MTLDYTLLESDFDCACKDVITNLTAQYKLNYQSGGPGKLEAFLELIKSQFDKAADTFLVANSLNSNTEAQHFVHNIAKKHARECLEVYGKLMQ
jgi:hypothetical protein